MHACLHTVYVFTVGLHSLKCRQVCHVNMLWPGEAPTVPGNAGISTTVTDQWPLTSDWELVDWPVNQTAANKQPSLSASFLSRLLSSSRNAATLCPLASDHRAPLSLPIWLQLNQTVDPLSLYSEPEERQDSQCYLLQAYPGAASSAVTRRSSLWMNWKNKAS